MLKEGLLKVLPCASIRADTCSVEVQNMVLCKLVRQYRQSLSFSYRYSVPGMLGKINLCKPFDRDAQCAITQHIATAL